MASTKSSSRRKTTGKGAQDAIALLKADHTKVQGLFDQFEKSRTESRKQSLAQEICTELKVHTAIEEEIFYPAAREAVDDSDLLDEAALDPYAFMRDAYLQRRAAQVADSHGENAHFDDEEEGFYDEEAPAPAPAAAP